MNIQKGPFKMSPGLCMCVCVYVCICCIYISLSLDLDHRIIDLSSSIIMRIFITASQWGFFLVLNLTCLLRLANESTGGEWVFHYYLGKIHK